MVKKLTPIIAMVIIGGLEFYAINQGINGALLGGVVAIIAGLGGYTIGVKTSPK